MTQRNEKSEEAGIPEGLLVGLFIRIFYELWIFKSDLDFVF